MKLWDKSPQLLKVRKSPECLIKNLDEKVYDYDVKYAREPNDTKGLNEITQNELSDISDVNDLARPETQSLLAIR